MMTGVPILVPPWQDASLCCNDSPFEQEQGDIPTEDTLSLEQHEGIPPVTISIELIASPLTRFLCLFVSNYFGRRFFIIVWYWDVVIFLEFLDKRVEMFQFGSLTL